MHFYNLSNKVCPIYLEYHNENILDWAFVPEKIDSSYDWTGYRLIHPMYHEDETDTKTRMHNCCRYYLQTRLWYMINISLLIHQNLKQNKQIAIFSLCDHHCQSLVTYSYNIKLGFVYLVSLVWFSRLCERHMINIASCRPIGTIGTLVITVHFMSFWGKPMEVIKLGNGRIEWMLQLKSVVIKEFRLFGRFSLPFVWFLCSILTNSAK